jgi:hypothetical protein
MLLFSLNQAAPPPDGLFLIVEGEEFPGAGSHGGRETDER